MTKPLGVVLQLVAGLIILNGVPKLFDGNVVVGIVQVMVGLFILMLGRRSLRHA